MGGARLGSRAVLGFCLLALALAVPAGAFAAFPGSDPAESPRANTPNDPGFDPCELDDAETPGVPPACKSFFQEQFGAFGFSPDSANTVPLAPQELHSATATQYLDCAQLDAQGKAANVADGVPACSQIAGVRADTAWKYSTGDPDTVVAVLDTGIRWQDRELVDKVHLNKGELPQPQADAGAKACNQFTGGYDANGDGAFNVRDYACDTRVTAAAGDQEADDILDGSDLIATFSGDLDSDGDPDDDANGYDDDIAGWDFFDDDNDPFDASSCCSANGHGSGRAKEAVASTNNGQADTGMCPECQLMPLRIWDTFVVPTDFQAMGVVYAADNGASVTEAANGGLTNTRFSRRAYQYADSKGLALMSVSSDINSANHNYPTNYNEAIYVAGALPDTAPFDSCDGLSLPLVGNPVPLPPDAQQACTDFFGLLSTSLGLTPSAQPPTTSFFRNSNLTQYGGKADIVLMGATGSENTGQSAGAAGLLASYGREIFGDDDPLSGNEIRQLLTMTAEDVRPLNTGVLGQPDKAQIGWDPHFGYGRVNLAGAMARIHDQRIPPEAELDAPDWFAPIDVDRVEAGGVPIRGHIASPHSDTGVGAWQVDYACGADAPDSTFQPVPGASGTGAKDGLLGTIPKAILMTLANSCDGSVGVDAGRPVGATSDGSVPGDAYPKPDPERHSFQIRLTVKEAGHPNNIGRYRKALFAYRDDGNLPGWPRPIGSDSDAANYRTGSGGEVPPRLYDLNGDNALDVIQATSSGEVYVLDSGGDSLPSFNGGQPVTTQTLALAAAHGASGVTGGVPLENPRAPAIGDLNGDLSPDIVLNAGERVYAWDRHGVPLEGFPVRTDPQLSDPCIDGVAKPCFNTDDRRITTQNHIKRGFLGAAALADLDGDGTLDVVAGSLDQHVYAWDGNGDALPGFPVKLASAGADGAEIVTSPAIAELDGDPTPEVVLATNEVIPGDPQLPSNPFDIINAILGSSTGSNPVYAINGDGTPVPGWPVKVGVAAGDLLPLVLPGHDASVFDQDGDGRDEVVVSGGTSLGNGGTRVVDGTGATDTPLEELSGNSADPGLVLNLADYSSIGALQGDSPNIIKGGLTVNGAANLLAVNQNLPFAHVVQAWDATTGNGVPAYPRATDDFQLLGQPAVANVAGSGAGRFTLYGTGLYQLHAYGIDGLEPTGGPGTADDWPKFTGGWTQSTPAVGDVDGDGDLDVSALTREGWSFLWDTGTPACDSQGASTNDEWWTFHHDEQGSNNYGNDGRPPGTVGGLAATRDVGAGTTTLTWTAPGDDWECGTAAKYRVVLGDGLISDPADADSTAKEDDAGPQGSSETDTFTDAALGNATHAAVFYRDEAGNWGLVKDVVLPDRGGNPPGACATKILGDAGANSLIGTGASERLAGRGGDDKIRGNGGNDCAGGGSGRDKVGGGAGNDKVSGGPGRDRLSGGTGDDTIKAADRTKDRIRCGPGEDTAKINKRDRTRGCEHVTRK